VNLRFILSLSIILFTSALSYSQSRIKGDSLIAGELLLQDLAFVKEKILETHQSPFMYTSEASFEEAMHQAALLCSTGLNYYQFSRVLARTLKVLKDSHTYVDYKSLIDPYTNAGGYYLPFTIYSIDDKLYCVKDELDVIDKGSRITRIAGLSAEKCADVVLEYAVTEGNSIHGERRIRDGIFNAILPTYLQIDSICEICFIPPGSTDTLCANYSAMTRDEIKAMRKQENKDLKGNRFIKKHGAVYKFEIIDSLDLGILRIGSFTYGKGSTYQKFLKKSFKQAKKEKLEHLVIDLRDNTGGKSNRAELLLSYLAPGKINLPANIIAKQSPTAQERNNKSFKGFNKFMLNHVMRKNEEVENYLSMIHLPNGEVDTLYYREPHSTSKWKYGGELFLWMNGRSASASVNTAACFRREGLGLILGEPCLGPETGTWGNPSQIKLPNTGLAINLSTIRFNADNSFRTILEPVQPDIWIDWTPQDLQLEEDPFRKSILNLLKD